MFAFANVNKLDLADMIDCRKGKIGFTINEFTNSSLLGYNRNL